MVSNEFGDLGIDGALLEQDDYVELAGGCVCCNLSDELVETLQMLKDRVAPDRACQLLSGAACPSTEADCSVAAHPVRGRTI